MTLLTRRNALIVGATGAGLMLSSCDRLTQSSSFQRVLGAAQDWTRLSQRLLLSPGQLAREYKPSDISKVFKPNGTLNPGGPYYSASAADNFADWQLRIDGMVAHPMSLSLAELKKLPARSQITRHDCVEGWSAIGGWTGVPLGLLLTAAGISPQAKYVVFLCADNLNGEPAKGGEQAPGQYYESIGLADAFHPQTIMAYAMNAEPLDIPHGAPLRLRVERQLGYKSAKYVARIVVSDTLEGFGAGKGGYWEDRGYEWYAGI